MKLDLEAIAVRRAEEQLSRFVFDERPIAPKRKPGPKLTDRTCDYGCGARLAETNRSGFCAKCSVKHWRQIEARASRLAERSGS